jgi:tRNA pseudouridine55 synthase
MDGVLAINKASGMTSHDVVAVARRLLHEKRIGHAGTLDPLATGVLVLCVGKATRIAQYLEAGEKEYRVVMKLGVVTDTLDADGRVLETTSYDPPSLERVEKVVNGFAGEIEQTPPAYSAVKVNGVPSYARARKGEDIRNKSRIVTIHSLKIVSYVDPLIELKVRCSKGTYIRTLCADIGSKLGTGAHVTELQRTRSGDFPIERTVTLDELGRAAEEGRAEHTLASVDEALKRFPAVIVRETDVLRVAQGNFIADIAPPVVENDANGERLRLHDERGRLLALASRDNGKLKMELVFVAPDDVKSE